MLTIYCPYFHSFYRSSESKTITILPYQDTSIFPYTSTPLYMALIKVKQYHNFQKHSYFLLIDFFPVINTEKIRTIKIRRPYIIEIGIKIRAINIHRNDQFTFF